MAEFPHLKIKQSIEAKYRSPYGGGKKTKSPITLGNLNDRSGHGKNLLNQTNRIIEEWENVQKERMEIGLPPLPEAIPLFLRIDPKGLKIDSLRGFGIEVISVEDDGVIIGASIEGDLQLKGLKKKIQAFLSETGRDKDQVAKLWNIEEGYKWRIANILSDSLQEKWERIEEDNIYIIDIGVSCSILISDYPSKDPEETENHYLLKVQRWKDKKVQIEIKRDEIALKRQTQLEQSFILETYLAERLTSYQDFGDSFGVRIKINGKGLKDLVLNYSYLFEVNEYDPYLIDSFPNEQMEEQNELDFVSPDQNAPRICVIDSGIQENHRYITDAILTKHSKSYITEESSTADLVSNGGHGTKVTGAVLFSNSIPRSGTYQHHSWIMNAKVLNKYNSLPYELYPPHLMQRIIYDYLPLNSRLYNVSINSQFPCRTKHMSDWSASIDKLIWERDVLFVISAGNIGRRTNDPFNPGIKEHLLASRNYPTFLNEKSTRIANPAQSFFSLTVGSICNGEFEDENWKSFGTTDEISSFSRTGLGIWGSIKPDVVEYGGDWIGEKNSNPNLSSRHEASVELIQSTLEGIPAIGTDIGTSFATPKVTHIAAKILSQWTNASSLFIRALVTQSARWSEKANGYNPFNALRYFGYGLPSLERALDNSKSRITFVAENTIQAKKAHIYSFKIPEELRRQGDSHIFLLEVSLAYKANIRRTRKGSHSYVSAWVDWMSSKLGESEKVFQERVTDYTNSEEDEFIEEEETPEVIQWTIREQKDWGKIKGVKRNDSSLQKDWVYLKSFELTESISFAVVGHKGWEKDLEQEVPYCMFISLECLNSEISIYKKIQAENEANVEIEI